jgi:hypothetical protein
MAHFYDEFGNPVYEVKKAKSDEMRGTTITDARKLGLVPGTTEVTGQIGKEGILPWTIGIILDTIKENQWVFNKEDYKKLANALAKPRLEQAMLRGTELHDKLEKYFKIRQLCETDKQFILPVYEDINSRFQNYEWISEAGFAHPLGFGGKVDLHSKSNNGIIIDFKTKAKDSLNDSLCYSDYAMQLAAYRLGLAIPKAECYNLLISTTIPGVIHYRKYTEEELEIGLEKFKLLLKYWQLNNKHDSRFGDHKNELKKSESINSNQQEYKGCI